MLNDKFVYAICIISLVLCGVYLTLIFQGLSLNYLLSSLANLATIGGFILAIYAISIWKNKTKLAFVYTELLILQKQTNDVMGHFNLSKTYGVGSQKSLFEKSLNKVFEFESSLRHFQFSYEMALGIDFTERVFSKMRAIEDFKSHMTLLKSLTVTERYINNSTLSDIEIIYLALNHQDQLSSYMSQMKDIFTNKNIYFNEIKDELNLLSKQL